jgi:hypothetical protein
MGEELRSLIMNSTKIIIASVIMFSLVGCSTSSGPDTGSWARWSSFKSMWSGGKGQPQGRAVQYSNGQSGYYPKAYKAPRKYYVTKQDQQSYQNLNNKIDQHMQSQHPNLTGVSGPTSSGNGMMLPQQNAPAANHAPMTPSSSTVPMAAPQ